MMYDIKTNNLSFLKLAMELKNNGVRNNKFMLSLYDESLSGLNVYDSNLTAEQKSKIFVEISKNYWYFLREVCKVPQDGNSEGTLFILNKGSLAASFCNYKSINNIFIIARQQGKTITEVAFSLWLHLFAGSYVTENYFHKKMDGATDNLARFKKMKELLPQWLLAIVLDREDKDNIEGKYFNKRKNTLKAMPSAANDQMADKVGRGGSSSNVYFDEFAFLDRNRIIMNAMVPAYAKSASIAKKNGIPHGIRITTTPNNLSLPQARYCYNMIQSACKFNYNFYDLSDADLEDYVHKNSMNDFVYIYYSYQDLGLGQDWYMSLLRTMNNDRANALRELDCEWPDASEDNVFIQEQLDKIKIHLKPIITTLNINNYAVSFYERPDFKLNYIISCDCSGGLSLDRSVITIIHPKDFHVVAIFANSRIDTDSFRELIFKLSTFYFRNSVVNIENNSMGIAILDALMKTELEPRLYKEYVERQAEKTLSDGNVVKQKTKRLVYGTSTNTKSRELMFELLPAIVDDEPDVFVSDLFFGELKNLVRNKHGKVEARSGFHDDIIMSYLITRYSLNYGKTFQTLFHINSIASESNMHTIELDNAQLASFSNFIDNANRSTFENSNNILDNLNSINSNTAIATAADQLLKDKMGYSGNTYGEDIFDKIFKINK